MGDSVHQMIRLTWYKTILGDSGAASRNDGTFSGERYLLPENIASPRLAAPESPRMVQNRPVRKRERKTPCTVSRAYQVANKCL